MFIVAYDVTERKLMEERVLESEIRFRDVILSTSDRVWEVDAEWRYSYCSEQIEELLGYPAQEVLGKTPFDFVHPYDLPRVKLVCKQLAARKEPIKDLVNRNIRKNGEEVILLTNGVPILGDDGELIGYRGLDHDITERVKTQEKLEQKSRDLAHRVKELDCQQRISKLLNETGITLEEVMQSVVDHLPAGFRDPASTAVRIEIEGDEYRKGDFTASPESLQIPIILHDEILGQIEVCILNPEATADSALFLDEERSMVELIAQRLSHHLERRRITTELMQSEGRIRAITDTATDPIIMIDSNAQVTFWNPAAEELFGIGWCEASGMNLNEVIQDDSSQRSFKQVITGHASSDESSKDNRVLEFTGRHHNGNQFPIEISLSNEMIENETQTVCIIRDISERRKAQVKLQQANKMESIGTLAAGVAHEINTPTQFVANNLHFLNDSFRELLELLSTIQGLLNGECAPENQVSKVDVMRKALEEADLDYLIEEIPQAIEQSEGGISTVSRIVSSMKAFAHPGAERKSNANLNKIISDTVTISRNEWKYVADLEADLEDTLPDVPCFTGPLGQVVLNLITNSAHAIKSAQEDGGAESESGNGAKGLIRISTFKNGDNAVMRITDNGTGIPPEISRRIFDPFFTTKDVGKGTGQGLSLAHSVVVKNHNGKIELDSEVGQGTTFTVTLPLETEEVSQ